MKKLACFASFLLAACADRPSILPLPGASASESAAILAPRVAEDPRDTFRKAIRLCDTGDDLAAEPLFLSSLRNLPTFADYALRYLAKIAQARGDAQTALDRWQSLADQFPISPWRGEAALSLARARGAEGDLAEAEHWLDEARRDASQPAEQAAILQLSSRVAMARGDSATAQALTVELRTRYPASPEAHEARDQAWAEREHVALNRMEDARTEASLRLSEGDGEHALDLVREAERLWPQHPDLPALRLLEASALKKTGDVEGAIRVLEDLRKRFPRHPAAAQALFRLASLAWNRDQDQTALKLFDLYARHHPRGELAAESVYATGRIHQEASRYADAARRFDRLARIYPSSSLAADAAWRVGWCEYRAGRMRKAAAVFSAVARRPESYRAAALYWKARALERAGVSASDVYEALLGQFPESYYAMLAERRTSRREGSAIAERARAADAVVGPGLVATSIPSLPRFDELRAMDLKPLARVELAAYAQRTSNADPLILARAFAEVDGYRQAIQVAVRQHLCALESPLLSLCYPLAFWPFIQRETDRQGLDPFLVLAVVRQESLFDTEAVSSADARGLMQLLPSTADRIARKIAREDFQPKNLFDAEQNLLLGMTYLRDLLARYQGDMTRALAAYNAGEAAVDKWQARHGQLEDDEFVESISYRETLNYVKRVLQNHRIYRALYPQALAQSAG